MNNIIIYKGYWAEIRYSSEDGCFWGEVEGLKNTAISFEGNTVDEIKKDFQDAIDNYLMLCEESNEKPEKQSKRAFTRFTNLMAQK